MYPSALKREKLFACVFECIKKGFYTKCHYWLRISVHLTNGFRVSVLEAYNVDINSVTADSRFPLSADGAMPVAYVCHFKPAAALAGLIATLPHIAMCGQTLTQGPRLLGCCCCMVGLPRDWAVARGGARQRRAVGCSPLTQAHWQS